MGITGNEQGTVTNDIEAVSGVKVSLFAEESHFSWSYMFHNGECDICLHDKLQGSVTNAHLFFFFFTLQFTGLVISQLMGKTCLGKYPKCVDIRITLFHFS